MCRADSDALQTKPYLHFIHDMHLQKMSDDLDVEHVYFEPKYCSDVQLRYDSTYYHAHRSILACNSKYFYGLFESLPAAELAEPIEIPKLSRTTFYGCSIHKKWFGLFLNLCYDRKFESVYIMGQNGLICPSVCYLLHYFQCEEFEAKIQEATVKWFSSNKVTLGTWAACLHEAEMFHWNRVKTYLVDLIASKQGLLPIGEDPEYTNYWYNNISLATKADILRRLLHIPAVPATDVPITL